MLFLIFLSELYWMNFIFVYLVSLVYLIAEQRFGQFLLQVCMCQNVWYFLEYMFVMQLLVKNIPISAKQSCNQVCIPGVGVSLYILWPFSHVVLPFPLCVFNLLLHTEIFPSLFALWCIASNHLTQICLNGLFFLWYFYNHCALSQQLKVKYHFLTSHLKLKPSNLKLWPEWMMWFSWSDVKLY